MKTAKNPLNTLPGIAFMYTELEVMLQLFNFKQESVTDLPILEITIDLLRSVEQVEHLEKRN